MRPQTKVPRQERRVFCPATFFLPQEWLYCTAWMLGSRFLLGFAHFWSWFLSCLISPDFLVPVTVLSYCCWWTLALTGIRVEMLFIGSIWEVFQYWSARRKAGAVPFCSCIPFYLFRLPLPLLWAVFHWQLSSRLRLLFAHYFMLRHGAARPLPHAEMACVFLCWSMPFSSVPTIKNMERNKAHLLAPVISRGCIYEMEGGIRTVAFA